MTVQNGSTYEHVIGAAGRFQLRLMSGSIDVRAVDGETVRVTERSGKSIAEVFRVDAGEGRLSLTSPDRGGIDLVVFGIGRRSSLDLEVEVPRQANVSIESASADVTIVGLVARIAVRTASGDVGMRAVGGNLELDAVSGEVTVNADAPIDIRARTISGDLAVHAPQIRQAAIETTSGDVRLDALLAGDGPFDIQTVSGDATIVGRAGLRIEARTVTGDLRSDLPHRLDKSPGHKQLLIGDGATTLGFRSVSGDLRVVAPRDGSASTLSTVAGAPAAPVAPVAPVRPARPLPPEAPAAPAANGVAERHEAGHEVARLDILHALERGELSVETAMQRLADIEEA